MLFFGLIVLYCLRLELGNTFGLLSLLSHLVQPPPPGYPTTPGAYDESHNGDYDAFVAKLGENLGALLSSTFLGGGDADYGRDLAMDMGGNTVLVGRTASDDFPTTVGAFDETFNGSTDGFVTKFADGEAMVPAASVGAEPLVSGLGMTRAFPNPARGETRLRFSAPEAGAAAVRIYNAGGRLVRTLPETFVARGAQELLWDGADDSGLPVRSGIYFYTVTVGPETASGKIAMVR